MYALHLYLSICIQIIWLLLLDYQLLFIPSATSQPRRLNANLMHLLLWPITLAAATITIRQESQIGWIELIRTSKYLSRDFQHWILVNSKSIGNDYNITNIPFTTQSAETSVVHFGVTGATSRGTSAWMARRRVLILVRVTGCILRTLYIYILQLLRIIHKLNTVVTNRCMCAWRTWTWIEKHIRLKTPHHATSYAWHVHYHAFHNIFS